MGRWQTETHFTHSFSFIARGKSPWFQNCLIFKRLSRLNFTYEILFQPFITRQGEKVFVVCLFALSLVIQYRHFNWAKAQQDRSVALFLKHKRLGSGLMRAHRSSEKTLKPVSIFGSKFSKNLLFSFSFLNITVFVSRVFTPMVWVI